MPHQDPRLPGSLGDDVFEEGIHRAIPAIARQIVKQLPASWFDEPEENVTWQMAVPLLSTVIAQLVPGRRASLANYRAAFSAALTNAVAEHHKALREGGGTQKDTKAKEERSMDPTVIVHKTTEGGVDRYTSHHPSCVNLPPRTFDETFTGRGGKPQQRKKPNPALREMPRSHAKAQGIAEHTECMPIFAAMGVEAKATSMRRKKPAEIVDELTDAERTKLGVKLQALDAARRQRVMGEFEARLTSVGELRGILALSEVMPIEEAVELLTDVTETLAHAWKAVRRVGAAPRADLQAAAVASAVALEATSTALKASATGAWARIRARHNR